jgi:lysophospholipase L1-like esterase
MSQRLLALGLGLALVAGLLGTIEALARFIAVEHEASLFSDPTLRKRNRPFVTAHETRGFALTPGFWSPGVRVSREGLRETSSRAEADTSDSLVILALGDSTTFGWGVRDEDSWPAQLERLLDAPGRRVRVLNAGVPSYTSSQVKLQLAELLERKRPDVILASVLWNDLWFSRIDPWYPELLIFIQPRPWRRFLVQHSAFYRWLMFRGRTADGASPSPSAGARQQYVENLESMARLASEVGVPLYLVKPPFDPAHVGGNYLNLGSWPTADLLREARAWLREAETAAAGFDAHAIDHRLAAGAPGQPALFVDDIHPNRAGYARIAEDVASALRTSLPRHFWGSSD